MSTQKKTPADKTPTKPENNMLKFFVAFVVISLVTVAYFVYGKVFMLQADFYTKYKMNGRFPDRRPYTTDFPYVNYFTETDENTLLGRVMKWVTEMMITSFSDNRFLLDKFLEHTGNYINESPGYAKTLFFLAGPPIIAAMLMASSAMGFFSTFAGAFSNLELVYPTPIEFIIMVIPFCIPLAIYGMVLTGTVFATGYSMAAVQTVMMAGFMLVMPLMNKSTRGAIINSLVDNIYLIMVTLFAAMTIYSFGKLPKEYGYISLGMAVASLLIYMFMSTL